MLLLLLLLQLSFHSVAVALTLVQTKNKNKYTETKYYKNSVQTIQNTLNKSTNITNKKPTHYKNHTYTHPHITKQVKTATVQGRHQMKQSQHNQVPSV
jgi:hypothetical protein